MDNKKETYSSPKAENIEVMVPHVLCQSGITEDGNEGSTSGWF